MRIGPLLGCAKAQHEVTRVGLNNQVPHVTIGAIIVGSLGAYDDGVVGWPPNIPVYGPFLVPKPIPVLVKCPPQVIGPADNPPFLESWILNISRRREVELGHRGSVVIVVALALITLA